MIYARLAEHIFLIKNKFYYIERLYKDYIVPPVADDAVFAVIHVTEEEIDGENKKNLHMNKGYLESLAVYRKICEELVREGIILFHCSALMIDGNAYLFTAPSGTGKSTHTRLWREYFGDRVQMINDDKPLLRISESGRIVVYGTPYAGKDGIQKNISCTVKGIVVLHQDSVNRIDVLEREEAYPMLLNQTHRVTATDGLIKMLDLVYELANVPCYSLGCTISYEAVEIACKALSGGSDDHN